VKGDKAMASFSCLDLEIPPGTQGGKFTTIEGLLQATEDALQQSQALRRALSAEDADSVDSFCSRLASVRRGEVFPFTFILDDPSGNSFVENPHAPRSDPRMKVRKYVRSQAQNEGLGLNLGNANEGGASGGGLDSINEEEVEAEAEEEDSSKMAGSLAEAVWRNKSVDSAGLLQAAKEKFLAEQASRWGQNVRSHSGAGSSGKKSGRDLSGNTPSAFKKGGAHISVPTVRSTLTAGSIPPTGGAAAVATDTGEPENATTLPPSVSYSPGRATSNRDSVGGLLSFVFDSSSSETAKEVMRFTVDCHNCGLAGECIMCCTDVPHFKEVILMGFSCDECGWKNVEVKGGGAVPPNGTITELLFTPGLGEASEEDLGRDVIKGDTASVEIPELELALDQGSLGGMYTTVEGLLNTVKDRLGEVDPLGMMGGDSIDCDRRSAMASFMAKLDACIQGTMSFTLRLVDPMANTWIHSPALSEGKEDPRLTHTAYTRSQDEDLELGLLDMCAPEGGDTTGEE